MAIFMAAMFGTTGSTAAVAAGGSATFTAASVAGGAATILAGAGAVFGAVQAHQAGKTAEAQAEFEADQLLVEGKIAAANAKKEENRAREALLANLAATNAAAGSSGIQVTSGTVESGREDAFRQANRELSTVRDDAILQETARRSRSSRLRLDADIARRTGNRDAVVGLTGAAARVLRRG